MATLVVDMACSRDALLVHDAYYLTWWCIQTPAVVDEPSHLSPLPIAVGGLGVYTLTLHHPSGDAAGNATLLAILLLATGPRQTSDPAESSGRGPYKWARLALMPIG